MKLSEAFDQYEDSFLEMSTEFETICDGHLRLLSIAKQRIELLPNETKPIRCTAYFPGPKARNFQKFETDEMLSMNVIEPAQTKWAPSIIVSSKQDGSLRFCVDKGNLMQPRYVIQILFPEWMIVSSHWDLQQYSRHWREEVSMSRLRSREKTDTRLYLLLTMVSFIFPECLSDYAIHPVLSREG